MIKSLPLVINKEEEFILEDGTAEGCSEHVPPEFVFRSAGEVIFPFIRVQFVIPEKLPDVAVVAIRPGLYSRTNDSALEVSELR